ncbi:MAG TPA: YiiX/YebB-like N1pC/P60 family cysteine hydrolase, partial [Candidatus Xenobia bacterium]
TLDKVRSLLQPGDIILSARNSNAVTFEPVMAMAGVGGDWVHTGIYNGDGKVYEQHNSMEQKPHASRARLSSLDEFVKRSNHLMILRPPYANAQEVQDTLKASQERLGQHYDYTFNLQNPSKMYCVAYTYLAVEKGAPSIQLAEPDRALGHDVVSPKTFQKTPGMEPIYSTGASFPLTYLSKFD